MYKVKYQHDLSDLKRGERGQDRKTKGEKLGPGGRYPSNYNIYAKSTDHLVGEYRLGAALCRPDRLGASGCCCIGGGVAATSLCPSIVLVDWGGGCGCAFLRSSAGGTVIAGAGSCGLLWTSGSVSLVDLAGCGDAGGVGGPWTVASCRHPGGGSGGSKSWPRSSWGSSWP